MEWRNPRDFQWKSRNVVVKPWRWECVAFYWEEDHWFVCFLIKRKRVTFETKAMMLQWIEWRNSTANQWLNKQSRLILSIDRNYFVVLQIIQSINETIPFIARTSWSTEWENWISYTRCFIHCSCCDIGNLGEEKMKENWRWKRSFTVSLPCWMVDVVVSLTEFITFRTGSAFSFNVWTTSSVGVLITGYFDSIWRIFRAA